MEETEVKEEGMSRISVLDGETVRKIAAGEVIERPASVVKELIENSIDACCKRVVVEIGKGGKDFIRVSDDGHGILADDVELAFVRHATSKIRRIEDLSSLRTLGFRGEALPSIAAVSTVEMRTRHESESFGTYLRVEGGVVKEKRQISRGVGTTVDVKRIFYNMPARAATLKSRIVEFRHILNVFTRLALIHSDVKFELFHDGKIIASTPGNGKMLDAVVSLFGVSVGKNLIEVNYADKYRIFGFISKPSNLYSTKKFMFMFVNGRYVHSETMENAVRRAYGTLLPKNKHPFAIISLEIPPKDVDVNVHPRKEDVRFRNERDVAYSITEAVSKALKSAELMPEVAVSDTHTHASTLATHPSSHYLRGRAEQTQVSEEALVSEEAGVRGAVAGAEEESVEENERLDISLFPLYQLLDSYIVAQNDAGDIIIIDQHAAAERINYERLLEKYGKDAGKQALLKPIIPDLSPHQAQLLRENEDLLREMGFDLEKFGDDAYIIRAIPAVFNDLVEKWRESKGESRFEEGRAQEEISGVLERILEERSVREERLHTLLSTAACVASVKAGEKLSYEEMRAIVEALRKTKMPFTCPHGRPTMIRLSRRELERRFKRR